MKCVDGKIAIMLLIGKDGIRLVDGVNNRTGRLEVYKRGMWGTVCNDRFDVIDAEVACK